MAFPGKNEGFPSFFEIKLAYLIDQVLEGLYRWHHLLRDTAIARDSKKTNHWTIYWTKVKTSLIKRTRPLPKQSKRSNKLHAL